MWRRMVVASGVLLVGCELEEVTIVEVENVVVAEVYVDLAADPTDNIARAFLHRTVGLEGGEIDPLKGSVVTMSRADGYSFSLTSEATRNCLESSPDIESGACFTAQSEVEAILPGDILEVRIELPDGGIVEGAVRLPGDFELDGIPAVCRVPPNTLMSIGWSRAERAWAYLNETSIRGLPQALEPEDIVVVDDPLYLLGLSVSDSDTNIVFPAEFGIFNRFDLDQDLAVRLQSGLPDGSAAEVSITAVDRNYVNWARGGNFNPSGQVRVPSLRGDGTGVFGATVGRRFNLIATRLIDTGIPECPTG